MTSTVERGLGAGSLARVEGVDKVTGAARYAYEYGADDVAYAWPVQSTIAKGRVTGVDVDAVLGRNGVFAVLWHGNAPRLQDAGDAVLAVLQSPDVAYRGQVVGLVVATTSEQAREAATQLGVRYDTAPHDSVLRPDHPSIYEPDKVNPDTDTDSIIGDPDGAFERSAIRVDATYRTPAEHNNPMEPHATTAAWDGSRLTVHDSNQGGQIVRERLSKAFAIEPADVHVVNAHVGGGFGSKGTPRPHVVLAAMAARVVGRPVKLALTRQQQFSMVGYRTPTIQRMRLGADADGVLRSISHDVVEQTGTLKEFAEQSAIITRVMYAAPHRRTTHALATLDVPVPSWMRAPGECPGSFALESAMDELAVAAGVDPVELRIRNEPSVHPEEGIAFSSRQLVECLRAGAERFGWSGRDPRPARRREGRELVGSGVASSTYPVNVSPATARVAVDRDGRYTVSINATDIGTGARTALLQIGAEALGVTADRVTILIGDTRLPRAGLAGGSAGTNSWGWAVHKAAATLADRLHEMRGPVGADGLEVTADTRDDVKALDESFSRHAFGAQFVEARVDVDTGEIRVPRMVGVFAAGRIVNARTARSQLIGGMTMGLSMALHEEGVMDGQFGDYANHDLATYHIASHADIGDIDVSWLDEDDPHLGGTRTKGIGEIGIVGTAAAVANAVYHATDVRLRSLPLHLEDLLPPTAPPDTR
ncbi:MAG: xanthine dehydrogenase family protein molybdopterin-binding subunit [Nocardioidaceae bacterium]